MFSTLYIIIVFLFYVVRTIQVRVEFKIQLAYVLLTVYEFPLMMIHEISHWIVAFVTFVCGLNHFPTIHINTYPLVENNGRGLSINGWGMYVNYDTDKNKRRRSRILNAIVACSPCLMTLILFLVSPWQLCMFYIPGLNILWMSVGDINMVSNLFDVYSRAKSIQSYKHFNRSIVCL